MNIVPVEIRSHLIPFYFQEMEGVMASYDGQKVKMVRLFPTSSLANYLYTHLNYQKCKSKESDNFILYLSIERKTMLRLSGIIYVETKGVKSVLEMDEKKVRAVNNLLEDLFRTSMVFFIDGVKTSGTTITKGINIFISRYNLEEYGFETHNLRQVYYNQKKKPIFNRLQTKSSNSCLGFI